MMELRELLDRKLEKQGVLILPAMEAQDSMRFILSLGYRPVTTILDPWYNRGIGGVRDDYVTYILEIINTIKDNTDHLFLWGFPEIAASFINKIDKPLEFAAWLTWFFKNCPSVIRGWRSSQQACLHYATKQAKMHPENFFNAEQELRFENNRMRFIPGPHSVIEEPLLVGFIGKKEQTGHPAQKPEKVYEKLILMSSLKDELVYDPMAGSGTTGAVCKTYKRKGIISDISDEYITLAEKRLGIKRLPQDMVKAAAQQPPPSPTASAWPPSLRLFQHGRLLLPSGATPCPVTLLLAIEARLRSRATAGGSGVVRCCA